MKLSPATLMAAVLVGLMAPAAPALGATDPTDRTQPTAPDDTPVCAKWVHDRHTVDKNGRPWATDLDVGGVFRARPAFGLDNAITQFDPAARQHRLQQADRLRPA